MVIALTETDTRAIFLKRIFDPILAVLKNFPTFLVLIALIETYNHIYDENLDPTSAGKKRCSDNITYAREIALILTYASSLFGMTIWI